MIDKKDIVALKLYSGDAEISNNDKIYRDNSVYETLNALLYPGISNEYSRIYNEKRKLNYHMIERIEETIELYSSIFKLMCEYKELNESNEIITKRVDRVSALDEFRKESSGINESKGSLPSFTSTSKTIFNDEFAKKDGVILLEIHIIASVPYLDLQKVLGDEYKHKDEAEILLAPFLNVKLNENVVKVSDSKERHLQDINKHKPIGKYQLYVSGLTDFSKDKSGFDFKSGLLEEIIERKMDVTSSMKAMINDEWDTDFTHYIEWKDKLQSILKWKLASMWYGGVSCDRE